MEYFCGHAFLLIFDDRFCFVLITKNTSVVHTLFTEVIFCAKIKLWLNKYYQE